MGDTWEKEFDKRFYFGVNCVHCWGDCHDLPCKCDDDKKMKQLGKDVKSFIQSTLAEYKRALELACQTCVDICTIDDGCSKCPLQTDEINDCGRNHIPTADQFHKKLLTQAREQLEAKDE